MMKALCLFLVLTNKSWALVDYTESETSAVKESSKLSGSSTAKVTKNGSSPLGHSSFDLNLNYEKATVQDSLGEGTASLMNLNGHFKTGHDIYLGVHYWMGTPDEDLSSDSKTQKGNATLLLGLNWLEFGEGMDRANVDIYGGAMLPEKNSFLASSRFDKIVGVESVKRFGDFGVGFGYEMRFAGLPKKDEETAVGNIQKITAGLGWQISGDIRFSVNASRVTIDRSKDTERTHVLKEKAIFGVISPELHLGISPLIRVELGARFMARPIKGDKNDLMAAKLWGLPGAYGNSLFAGLGVAL